MSDADFVGLRRYYSERTISKNRISSKYSISAGITIHLLHQWRGTVRDFRWSLGTNTDTTR